MQAKGTLHVTTGCSCSGTWTMQAPLSAKPDQTISLRFCTFAVSSNRSLCCAAGSSFPRLPVPGRSWFYAGECMRNCSFQKEHPGKLGGLGLLLFVTRHVHSISRTYVELNAIVRVVYSFGASQKHFFPSSSSSSSSISSIISYIFSPTSALQRQRHPLASTEIYV